MFMIKFYVDDKSVGEALKRLAGIARNLEHAYVPNLEPKPNGKVRMAAADTMEMFVKELHKRRLADFDAQKAREIAVSLGFSPTSYSYMLKGLVSQGVLKRTGTPQKMRYALKPEK